MSRHKRQSSIELLELMGIVQENGNEQMSRPHLYNPLAYDYVLVAKSREHLDRESIKKQNEFIEQLKRKKFKVTKILNDDLVFFGVKAPLEIFEKYRYLLKVSDTCNWSSDQNNLPLSTRIRVVHFILNHTPISSGGKMLLTYCQSSLKMEKAHLTALLILPEGLRVLMKTKVFEAKFCLHEKKKQRELTESWARWTACFQGQPITAVRNYFGEKVALYYLWLGWYTYMLVVPALIGVVVFLYGVAFFNTSPLIKEVCDIDVVMCPLCDKRCKVWLLSDTCTYAKVSLLFDNEGTVLFAMVMAVWATLFLEFWKRHRTSFVCEWKVSDWCEEEEELILHVVNNANTAPKKFKHSYLRSTLVLICVIIMILVIIGLTHVLVVFRVIAAVQLAEGSWEFMTTHSNSIAMMLGAVLHYLIITVMTRVNRSVAMKLCELEKTRSFATTERSFTVKMFTFQFFTYFSSLFYVAFFLGRINGHPGHYVRIASKWRLEECHPSGCLTDLFIQMAIIMVLKQTLSNVFEFTGPWFGKWLKRRRTHKLQRKCANCYLKDEAQVKLGAELCDNCKMRDWLNNYRLNDVDSFSLFKEFLEMMIQFSFTTIFVAAFPLAPLLALINNVIEIRLDAIKMVTLERRLIPKKTNDIGVWIDLLEAIGVLAVIANGLVIGVSSDFIPRLVYRFIYGPCANGTATDIDCMVGYINNTLSTVSTYNPEIRKEFSPLQMVTPNGANVTSCSYKDYRNNEDYNLTPQFWLILAVRFAFVILFEHIVVICKFIAAWFVPEAPMQVKNDSLYDKFERLKEELRSFEESQRRHFAGANGM
ncbi:anoctamin-9 isoform X2 [Syngnathus acus]|uniref:anoctamin-9 isoform X2 n=1 Tax=Syngnathus acus TaxID=161584 RepID=UPI0018863F33|nr:anoctamin-9 isoform X2 [Syngnathus acus]